MSPRLLELFCGTKSIGKEFAKAGFEVVSLDFDKQFEPTICGDILTLPDDYFDNQKFDAVWASPPCNAFSVAVIGRNWHHDHTPKNDTARNGLAILRKTLSFIDRIAPPMWWVENPRGGMKWFMDDRRRETVTYCTYGDTRMKPTHIWHNTGWVPRPHCSNGADCHEPAPRGSKTGTQGIKGSRDRAVIPQQLCRELAEYAALRLRIPRPEIGVGQQNTLFTQEIYV